MSLANPGEAQPPNTNTRIISAWGSPFCLSPLSPSWPPQIRPIFLGVFIFPPHFPRRSWKRHFPPHFPCHPPANQINSSSVLARLEATTLAFLGGRSGRALRCAKFARLIAFISVFVQVGWCYSSFFPAWEIWPWELPASNLRSWRLLALILLSDCRPGKPTQNFKLTEHQQFHRSRRGLQVYCKNPSSPLSLSNFFPKKKRKKIKCIFILLTEHLFLALVPLWNLYKFQSAGVSRWLDNKSYTKCSFSLFYFLVPSAPSFSWSFSIYLAFQKILECKTGNAFSSQMLSFVFLSSPLRLGKISFLFLRSAEGADVTSIRYIQEAGNQKSS